jgi:hypothetical protein
MHRAGAFYSWGYNLWGCLGDGTTVSRNAPVRVRLPERAVLAAASRASTCALLFGGQVWCWGRMHRIEISPSPVLIFSSHTHVGSVPRSIVAGSDHFCVVTVARAVCKAAGSADCLADDHGSNAAESAEAQRNDDTVW